MGVRRGLVRYSPWPGVRRRCRSGGQRGSDQPEAVNTSFLTDLPPWPSSCVTLPTSPSMTRRRLIRFANLIMAHSHRNSPHAVERTSPGPDGCRRHTTFHPRNWNATTTRDFTTRTSPRTRGFTPEVWLRFCGSPGVQDLRRVATSFGYQRQFVPYPRRQRSSDTRSSSFKFQQPQSMANQYQPPPTTIMLAPSYDFHFCVRNRTWFLISSASLAWSGHARAKAILVLPPWRCSYIERQATGDRLPMKTWDSYLWTHPNIPGRNICLWPGTIK